MRIFLFLMAFFWAGTAFADDDVADVDNGWGGNAQLACSVLSLATNGLDEVGAFETAQTDQAVANEAYLEQWGTILFEAQEETGLSIASIDAALLAETMVGVEAEALAEEPESDGGMSAFDIARTTMSVASIADPTGVIGVAAAYTYPICNTQDAKDSGGGFCWRDSQVRDAGEWVKNAGRVADCPSGYTNNGLTCGRGGDSYAHPSRVADCPSGYTNNGLTCGRGADSYAQASRVADCPGGYTNNGLTCGRGADSYSNRSSVANCPSGYTNMGLTCYKPPFSSKGLSSMTCRSGEWMQAGRCYKNCRAGYTNMGESCFRGASTKGLGSMTCKAGEWFQAGRCYKDCKAGYTNMGESCFRPVSTKGLEAMTCKPGEWFQAGRCYSDCREGYTNMGESCFRPVSTKGIEAMTCNGAGEFKQGPRCFDNDVCAPGKELDGLLCYDKCEGGTKGIGPVCWTSCQAPYGTACAAGCASSEAECGLATTDMVASPFEMVGSIATLGSMSGASSARKAASVAAKQAAKASIKQGAKAGIKKAAKAGLKSLDDLMIGVAKQSKIAGAEEGAKILRKGMIEGAQAAAKRTQDVVAFLKSNATKAKNAVKSNVFEPTKAKLINPTTKKLKSIDEATLKKVEIINKIRAAKTKVAQNRKLAYLKAARSCTKFGLTVADVSTE